MSQSVDFGCLQVTQIKVAQKKWTTNVTQRYTRTYRLSLWDGKQDILLSMKSDGMMQRETTKNTVTMN